METWDWIKLDTSEYGALNTLALEHWQMNGNHRENFKLIKTTVKKTYVFRPPILSSKYSVKCCFYSFKLVPRKKCETLQLNSSAGICSHLLPLLTAHFKFEAEFVAPTHYTLQTEHYTIHTSNWTLYSAHCTLQTTLWALHTNLTIHTTHCTLHTVHCTLHTVHCTLYTANCSLQTAV